MLESAPQERHPSRCALQDEVSCSIDEGIELSADVQAQDMIGAPDVDSTSDMRLGDPNSV
jgi:hypothetical protein